MALGNAWLYPLTANRLQDKDLHLRNVNLLCSKESQIISFIRFDPKLQIWDANQILHDMACKGHNSSISPITINKDPCISVAGGRQLCRALQNTDSPPQFSCGIHPHR